MASAEVAATGLALPEGPVALPDGCVAFGEMGRGQVSLFDGATVTSLAATRGSPNGLALGSDDALYVAQNGGVEGDWRSDDPVEPGIQRVGLDGTVTRVATSIGGVATLTPNDLAFGPDGRLWITDPAHGYDPAGRGEVGRVFVLGPDEGEVALWLAPVYPNGIGFDVSGSLLWVESYERRVCTLVNDRATTRCLLPVDHVPDGFAIAADGRMFIATVTSHAVTVVAPDDTVADVIALDGGAIPTNCCFDGSVLWVTDFGPEHPSDRGGGRLWRLDTDAQGLELHTGMIRDPVVDAGEPLPTPQHAGM